MKKRAIEFLRADLGTLNAMLASRAPDSNVSLIWRKEQVEQELRQLENTPLDYAEFGVFFSGEPLRSMGLDANFICKVLPHLQTLVCSRLKIRSAVMPPRTELPFVLGEDTTGAVGFALPAPDESDLVRDAGLKAAVEDIAKLFARLARNKIPTYSTNLDEDLIAALIGFFEILHTHHASTDVLQENLESHFDPAATEQTFKSLLLLPRQV